MTLTGGWVGGSGLPHALLYQESFGGEAEGEVHGEAHLLGEGVQLVHEASWGGDGDLGSVQAGLKASASGQGIAEDRWLGVGVVEGFAE